MKRDDIDVKNIINEKERVEMKDKLYGRRSDKNKLNQQSVPTVNQVRRSSRVKKQPDRYKPPDIRKPVAPKSKPVPPKPVPPKSKPVESDSDSSSSSSNVKVDLKPSNQQVRRRKMILRRRKMLRNKISSMKSNNNNNNTNLRRSTRIRKQPDRYKP